MKGLGEYIYNVVLHQSLDEVLAISKHGQKGGVGIKNY